MTRPGNNSQQHANEQRAARRAVTAGPLCRIIVKRPRLLCAMVALVPLLATVIIALTHSFKITDPSGVDYLVRNDLRTVQDAARRAAREYTGNIRNQILPPPSVEPSREQHGLSTGNRSFSTTGPKGDIERGDEIDTYALHFLFRVRPQPGAAPIKDVREANRAPNVLTPEYLAQIKQAEDKLISNPKYQDFCWVDIAARSCNGQRPPCAFRRSITLHPLLYGLNDTDGRVCGVRDDANPVSRVQFDLFLRALIVSDPRGNRRIDPEYAWFLGRDAAASTLLEPSSLRTFVIRSYFPFGLPLRGYNTVDSDRSEQDDKFKSWALDVVTPIQESVTDPPQSRLHLIAVGDEYANNVFGIQALKDLSFAIAAIVLVLLFIWIHTRSLFLALAAMLQVILAFPLSYFFYRVVAQVRYFSALQIMCIFLVLGIAADDCFVFIDAWKQAAVVLGPTCDLERRLRWTYHRAVKAMTVTSFTTAVAFALTATSPIMPIGTLGIWAALLVVLQYVLVISMFPCAVIIWHRSLRPRRWRSFLKKHEAPQLITPEDDEADFDVEHVDGLDKHVHEEMKDIDLSSSHGNENGTESSNAPRLPWWKRFFTARTRDENEYRSVERFFRFKWAVWMDKIRFLLLAVLIVLFAVSIYLTTRLQPLTESEQFLPASHPIRVAFTLLKYAFPASDTDYVVTVFVVWGVSGVDRSGTSKYKPTENGRVVFDKSLDLRAAETQQHLLSACEMIESAPGLVSTNVESASDCWIRDFRRWRTYVNKSEEFETYSNDTAFVNELRSFLGFKNKTVSNVTIAPFYRYLDEQRIGFATDPERVVYTEFRFVTDVRGQEPYKVMWPFYEKWRDLVKKINLEGPQTAKNAYAIAPYDWSWMITQNQLVKNALVGVVTMLAVALVVLSLSTLNIVASLWAIVAITGVVLNLLALIYLFGWELGITESVGIIIATGISFDYASHIANAYVESSATKRFDRVQDALTNLGISVMAGAISTLVAGSMLFFAVITFFGKFAAFVVSTVTLSLIWSTTFLVALLLTFGPQHNWGSLKPMLSKLNSLFPRRKRSDSTFNSDRNSNNEASTVTSRAADVNDEHVVVDAAVPLTNNQ